jgi:DNA-repair protein complementing XP-A cells
MVNSKGGFLIDDGKKVHDDDMRRKELEREKQRKQHNLDIREPTMPSLSI